MNIELIEEKTMNYTDFLETKRFIDIPTGLTEIPELNPMLFDFQKDIVSWALKRGRACIFADCGLGKTPMQLEWANIVSIQTGKPVLILAPLAVSAQTVREGEKFHIHIEKLLPETEIKIGIYITNYEQLHKYDLSVFGGIVLDESSILKNFSGKYRKEITEVSQQIPFRLACTATPAPNDLIELINHAEFLGIMGGKEIIALFFTQDGNTTQKWRLKGHAEAEFWKWVSTWAVAFRKPSDLGYSDEGYILPKLNIHKIEIEGHILPGELFQIEAQGLLDRRRARKESLVDRVKAAAGIADKYEPCLIWCDLNSESEMLTKSIAGAVEVKGADTNEHKESSMLGFSAGDVKKLVTKPSVAGWGMNWQHCNKIIFVGLSDSYEQYYQAVRRCWRFGQKKEVDVYIVTANTEGAVVKNIRRKEAQAAKMFDEIVKHMSFEGGRKSARKEEMIYMTDKTEGQDYTFYNGDSCEVIEQIESDSIGLSVFSPPFPGMYAYTNSPRDMGNVEDIPKMIKHFEYLIPELLRITMPGRNSAIHLTQTTAMKSRDGYIGIKDYRGATIAAMERHGWHYAGEVCIDKNPQIQATRNKERGLLFKSLATDSSVMRMALADYLLLFRKDGENPIPIRAGISERYGNPDGWITEAEWIEWAAPVWYRRVKKDTEGKRGTVGYPARFQITDGIKETDVLNVSAAREDKDERHLCPLQLGVIERAIKLWSAPGDTIFSPFGGIGSEGYQALKYNRKFIGIELKRSYYEQAVRNLNMAITERSKGELFQ